ncbi:hypothetical protein NKG99_07545 [Mesorhizobium sp. M1409]
MPQFTLAHLGEGRIPRLAAADRAVVPERALGFRDLLKQVPEFFEQLVDL